MAEEQQAEDLTALTGSLARFLELNPSSRIEQQAERIMLLRPWDDETLAMELHPSDRQLIDALNHLILPPTLTALYHTDSLELEFIFSVRPNDDPLWSREFDFVFGSATVHCRYDQSSDRLLSIAAASVRLRPRSPTDHRNLRIFADYSKPEQMPKALRSYFDDRTPMSFIVGPIEISSTDDIHDLARHLNFHMFYFDRYTPLIVIHSPESIQAAIFEQPRPEAEEFPGSIISTPLDPYVLDLLGGAQGSTGRLAYLYYYQILEYAAFYYFEEQVRLDVAKILRRPDILSSLDACLPLIVDELVEYRQSDEHKLRQVIQRAVDPIRVWKVVERYKDYFAAPIEFNGGFELPPLVRAEWSEEDFEAAWIPKVPDALRKVRNALVHSREYRLGHTIAPVRANLARLQPWVHLVEEISCEVALYRTI